MIRGYFLILVGSLQCILRVCEIFLHLCILKCRYEGMKTLILHSPFPPWRRKGEQSKRVHSKHVLDPRHAACVFNNTNMMILNIVVVPWCHRANPVVPFSFSLLLLQGWYTKWKCFQLLNFDSHITSLKGTQSPEKFIQLKNWIAKIKLTAFIITHAIS